MRSPKKTKAPSDLNFFEGFAWPVPRAFTSAVTAFRFESGDVLYSDASSYLKRPRKPKKGLRAIQVLERLANSAGSSSASEGEPRRANWESRIRVSVLDLASGKSTEVELTQGELFVLLWRGDEAVLLAGSGEVPAMPRTARELGQSLEAARDAILLRSKPARKSRRGSRFLFVVDESSDASRAKALTIEEGLRTLGATERLDLTPAEVGVSNAAEYHPAVRIRCLTIEEKDPAAVGEILRSRLYGGGGAADAGDRFSVARHGLLEALDADASSSAS